MSLNSDLYDVNLEGLGKSANDKQKEGKVEANAKEFYSRIKEDLKGVRDIIINYKGDKDVKPEEIISVLSMTAGYKNMESLIKDYVRENSAYEKVKKAGEGIIDLVKKMEKNAHYMLGQLEGTAIAAAVGGYKQNLKAQKEKVEESEKMVRKMEKIASGYIEA